jgi:hypothetical protein
LLAAWHVTIILGFFRRINLAQHAGGATMAAEARSNDAAAIMLRAIMSADGRQVGQQKGLGL